MALLQILKISVSILCSSSILMQMFPSGHGAELTGKEIGIQLRSLEMLMFL